MVANNERIAALAWSSPSLTDVWGRQPCYFCAVAHMFIMSPLAGGGLTSLFSTHPPVEKRIERLMAMRGQTLR